MRMDGMRGDLLVLLLGEGVRLVVLCQSRFLRGGGVGSLQIGPLKQKG